MSGKPPEGKLTYSSYLKVRELLSLQEPLSKPVAHDELLFIVIHQVYELWFKQILFELDALVHHLDDRDFIKSFRRLDRVVEIFRILVQQVDILETMTPIEFNAFRAHLNPASGFQSLQFRELEILGGADPAEYEKFADLNPEWKGQLAERVAKPSIRHAWLNLLKREGLLQGESTEEVRKAVLAIYVNAPIDSALRNLCEYFIRIDELVALWRFRHVQMVERMIGMKPGTGGSLGVAYLKSTLRRRFFPELWEARTEMTGAPYGA